MNFNEKDYTYPENLIAVVLGKESVTMVNDDIVKGLEYILSKITTRERYVLEYRYKEGYTLEEIGAKLEVSRERVRQIEMRAIRRLRHPNAVVYIKEGYSIASKEVLIALNEKYSALENERYQKLMEITELVEKLTMRADVIRGLCGDKYAVIMGEIDQIKKELPDLSENETLQALYDTKRMSARTFNGIIKFLEREHGEDKVNPETASLQDLVIYTEREVRRIRNLGEKSVNEILEILAEHNMKLADYNI